MELKTSQTKTSPRNESDVFFGTVIHTDGSVMERSTRSVAIIISGGKYLAELIEVRQKDNNSNYAELVAIEQSLKWLEDNQGLFSLPVRLYTDSLSICEVFSNLDKRKPKKQVALWNEIIRLSAMFNVDIIYKKGHNREINPNVVCDRLAGATCTGL